MASCCSYTDLPLMMESYFQLQILTQNHHIRIFAGGETPIFIEKPNCFCGIDGGTLYSAGQGDPHISDGSAHTVHEIGRRSCNGGCALSISSRKKCCEGADEFGSNVPQPPGRRREYIIQDSIYLKNYATDSRGDGDCSLQDARYGVRGYGGKVRTCGADYLGDGAMFPTRTKTDARLVSLCELQAIRQAASIPIVVIGEINRGNAALFPGMGIDRLAVISAILTRSAASELIDILSMHSPQIMWNRAG